MIKKKLKHVKRKKSKRNSPLEEYKNVLRKYLALNEEHEYIDFIWGVIYANRLDTDPVWAYLIGAPGSGKTVAVNPMDGHSGVRLVGTMNKASLLPSRKGRPPKDENKKKETPGVLAALDKKTLIIKDLTTMLNMDYEEFKAILGVLRDAYDGSHTRATGDGINKVTAKFGIIAAVTGVIDTHKIMNTELGERFISYRMKPVSKEEKKRKKDLAKKYKRSEKEDVMRAATYIMLDRNPQEPEVHVNYDKWIQETADLVAHARRSDKRNRQTRDVHLSEEEDPIRLYEELLAFTKGLAMANGRRNVIPDDIRLMRYVGLSCLPGKRIKLIETMLKDGLLTVDDFRKEKDWQGISATTIREEMQVLEMLGICKSKKIKQIRGAPETAWKLINADRWYRLVNKSDDDLLYGVGETG